MGFANCCECDAQISSRARACPRCGASQYEEKPKTIVKTGGNAHHLIIALLVVILLILYLAVFGWPY